MDGTNYKEYPNQQSQLQAANDVVLAIKILKRETKPFGLDGHIAKLERAIIKFKLGKISPEDLALVLDRTVERTSFRAGVRLKRSKDRPEGYNAENAKAALSTLKAKHTIFEENLPTVAVQPVTVTAPATPVAPTISTAPSTEAHTGAVVFQTRRTAVFPTVGKQISPVGGATSLQPSSLQQRIFNPETVLGALPRQPENNRVTTGLDFTKGKRGTSLGKKISGALSTLFNGFVSGLTPFTAATALALTLVSPSGDLQQRDITPLTNGDVTPDVSTAGFTQSGISHFLARSGATAAQEVTPETQQDAPAAQATATTIAELNFELQNHALSRTPFASYDLEGLDDHINHVAQQQAYTQTAMRSLLGNQDFLTEVGFAREAGMDVDTPLAAANQGDTGAFIRLAEQLADPHSTREEIMDIREIMLDGLGYGTRPFGPVATLAHNNYMEYARSNYEAMNRNAEPVSISDTEQLRDFMVWDGQFSALLINAQERDGFTIKPDVLEQAENGSITAITRILDAVTQINPESGFELRHALYEFASNNPMRNSETLRALDSNLSEALRLNNVLNGEAAAPEANVEEPTQQQAEITDESIMRDMIAAPEFQAFWTQAENVFSAHPRLVANAQNGSFADLNGLINILSNTDKPLAATMARYIDETLADTTFTQARFRFAQFSNSEALSEWTGDLTPSAREGFAQVTNTPLAPTPSAGDTPVNTEIATRGTNAPALETMSGSESSAVSNNTALLINGQDSEIIASVVRNGELHDLLEREVNRGLFRRDLYEQAMEGDFTALNNGIYHYGFHTISGALAMRVALDNAIQGAAFSQESEIPFRLHKEGYRDLLRLNNRGSEADSVSTVFTALANANPVTADNSRSMWSRFTSVASATVTRLTAG